MKYQKANSQSFQKYKIILTRKRLTIGKGKLYNFNIKDFYVEAGEGNGSK